MIVHTPDTLDEALELKQRYGTEGVVLAGGQSLVVLLQLRLAQPEAVISLQRLDELKSIAVNGVVEIGAMVTMAKAATDEQIRETAPSLARICGLVASPHVRNVGTVVGNACHAEPGSDPPQALLLLDADVQAQSARGSRWIPVREFFVSFLQTALEEDEIATAIRFPCQARGAETYIKHRRRQMDLAIVGIAATLTDEGGGKASLRVAAGGVGPRPVRASATEAGLGVRPVADILGMAAEIGAQAASEVAPTLSDAFGTSEYRRKLVQVSVRRATTALCRDLGAT